MVKAKLEYCKSSSSMNIDLTEINLLQVIQNVLARVVAKPSKHHHMHDPCPQVTRLAQAT